MPNQDRIKHILRYVTRKLLNICPWMRKSINVNRVLPVCVQECDHIEVQLCKSLLLLGCYEHKVRMSVDWYLVLAGMKYYCITKEQLIKKRATLNPKIYGQSLTASEPGGNNNELKITRERNLEEDCLCVLSMLLKRFSILLLPWIKNTIMDSIRKHLKSL